MASMADRALVAQEEEKMQLQQRCELEQQRSAECMKQLGSQRGEVQQFVESFQELQGNLAKALKQNKVC